jgi:uncharacterized protein YktB (UPF0637 family)
VASTRNANAGNLAKNKNALSEIVEDFLEKCPDHLKPEDEGRMNLINIGRHLELHDVISE